MDTALLVTVLLLLAATIQAQPYVNVTTSLGTVTGLHVVNSGIEYYSFRGIPYANVTQRFKASKPMEPWTSVVMATDDGPGCIQTDVIRATIVLTGESEDCLFVNVYTPQLPQPDNPKLPVMVFIHGGAFLEGAGSSYSYGPEFFMAENNVVLVSINHRVGLFGFLYTGTEDAPGNAGMKDQVLALRWIQKEISNFGGDPSRVTIFGESAGSAAVFLHIVSPMSKGLFHRAIAQSGSPLHKLLNVDANIGLERATRIAELLYCNTENATTIVSCLSRMSASALVQATIDLVNEENNLLVAVPAVESAKFDEDVFLPDFPVNLIDTLKQSTAVPLIVGVNDEEGIFFLSDKDEEYQYHDRNLQNFLPIHPLPDQHEAAVHKVREFYFNGEKVDKSKLKGFVQLFGDYMFLYPTVKIVRKFVEKKNDVYLYKFAYPKKSFNNFWPNEDADNLNYLGVGHGEELAFLFYSSSVQNLADVNSDDYKTMKKIIKLWTTFARTGTPVSSTDEMTKDIKWPKVTDPKDLVHLVMGDAFTVSHNYFKERVALWDQITASLQSSIGKDEL